LDPNIRACLEMIFRWIHVVAGIAWIGHLYFFNFVNSQVVKTYDADSKRKVVPELMPRALYWFRWGAAYTWVSGFLLAGMVYYQSENLLPPDSTIGTGAGRGRGTRVNRSKCVSRACTRISAMTASASPSFGISTIDAESRPR